MRCLYCGKQLALFRRLTGGGEFCSDAHKRAYHEEYNRLALTRLIAAQSRMEERKPIAAPSTMQIASGDRTGRALPMGSEPIPARRGLPPGAARMLDAAPADLAPPPVASFQRQPLETKPGRIPTPLQRSEPVPFLPTTASVSWSPDFRKSEDTPPQAPLTDLRSSILAAAPPAANPLSPAPVISHRPKLPSLAPSPRKTRSLVFRPQIPLGLTPYLPDITAKVKLADQPEPFRFAIMLFSGQALRLPLLNSSGFPAHSATKPPTTGAWDWDQYENSPHAAPVQTLLSSDSFAVTAAAPSAPDLAKTLPFDTRLPFTPDDPRETAHRRASTVKLKIASMAAQHTVAEQPKSESISDPPPTESRPAPKLPTLNPQRKAGAAMPSILQATEPTPEPPAEESKTSLWAALKKYISK